MKERAGGPLRGDLLGCEIQCLHSLGNTSIMAENSNAIFDTVDDDRSGTICEREFVDTYMANFGRSHR